MSSDDLLAVRLFRLTESILDQIQGEIFSELQEPLLLTDEVEEEFPLIWLPVEV